MKIACIGTYPPRVCGIATFTYNLRQSIVEYFNAPSSIFIVAINDNGQTYDYPEEVKFVINQQEQPDYLEAAEFINKSGADVCILEHEFGIFGGDSGIFILSLINNLKIPLIVTFHSVLKTPSFAQKAIIKSIGEHADRIIVMSHKAVDFLSKIYSIPIIKLKIIEHGVPVYKFDQAACKKKLNLENKIVLLTFGLLSNNKGIETVINALPDVVSKHPNVLYIVLGKTHPNVLRHSNEDYRNSLIKLAENHNLKDHILFRNEFVDEKLLFEYLYATDIYITPYLDEAQITSGTLAYAVGTGAAVVSTPYWHAAEILDHERGKLFDFNDYKELSSILNTLISNPRELQKFRNNAAEYGKKTSWPLMGREYIKVCVELSKLKRRASPSEPYYDMTGVPYFNLKHIQVLTDDTGIIQHSKFGVPNLKEGYCLDDNARALLMALMAYQFRKDEMALRLVPTYLKFVNYMQKDDGSFNNFLNFRRELYREDNSEDCFGRTIWSLGYLVRFAPKDAYLQAGKEFLVKATPHIDKLKTMRGIANSLIGISHYLKKFPNDEGL
ncbi:MAG: glycosyltransferase family 4 protein, partial [Bacteroidota bacterium]|nr:glycosyltransferase family 4 protein [Bacteroidota bacterium]